MKEGLLGGLNNLLHADALRVNSILYVLSYAAVKQHWLLRHYANLRSQERHIDCMRCMAINQLKINDDIIKTALMALQ